MNRPFCIGLTGGIGSGKSAVAARFQALGAVVVDTDRISHDLTHAGGAAIPAIRAIFGDAALDAQGALDRARMRERIFADPDARHCLEAILHPLIRTEAESRVRAAVAHPYVVLVVPLLIETGAYRDLIDRILVVDCDEAAQLRRVAERDGMDEVGVRAIMRVQASRAARLAEADDVIVNSGTLDGLDRQVRELHERYLVLAGG